MFRAYQSCENTNLMINTAAQQNKLSPFYDIEEIVAKMFLSLHRYIMFL